MKILTHIPVLLAFFFLLQSCSKDVGPVEENPQTQNVSFANDIQPIFEQNCVSCHPSSGNLDLTSGNSYANLVDVNASGYAGKLVIAGDSENSILYKKINGSGAYGSNMPLGGSLSATQITVIKQWIDEGAKDN